VAKIATNHLCTYFIEKCQAPCNYLGLECSPLQSYQLKLDFLRAVSLGELHHLAESFIIHSRCAEMTLSDSKHNLKAKKALRESQIETQKNRLKICNQLLLGLQVAITAQNPVQIKRIVTEIYNILTCLLNMKLKLPLLQQALIKVYQALHQVPYPLWDSNLRKVASSIAFELTTSSIQSNELEMSRHALLSDIDLPTRHWHLKEDSYYETAELTAEMEEARDKWLEYQRNPESTENPPVEWHEPEPVLKYRYKIVELENEGSSLDEWLLTLKNYSEIAETKSQIWKNRLSKLLPYARPAYTEQVSNMIDNIQSDIDNYVEFWKNIRSDPKTAFQKVQAASKDGERYLEFVCKAVRRLMEQGEITISQAGDMLKEAVYSPEDVAVVEKVIEKRRQRFEADKVPGKLSSKEITEKLLAKTIVMSGDTKKSTEGNPEDDHPQSEAGRSSDNGAQDDEEFDDQNVAISKHQKYTLLWVSELNLLKSSMVFFDFKLKSQPQENVGVNNFLDISFMEVNKIKQIIDECNKPVKIRATMEEREQEEEASKPQIPEQYVHLNQTLENLASACLFAQFSESWIQLQNILRFFWNAVTFDMANPQYMRFSGAWRPCGMISESLLVMIEYMKDGGLLRAVFKDDSGENLAGADNTFDDSNLRIAESTFAAGTTKKGVTFKLPSSKVDKLGKKTNKFSRNDEELDLEDAPKYYWFLDITNFDMSLLANIFSFGIQCLLAAERWESVIYLAERFNKCTEDYYAGFLLPFVIFAEQTLLDRAEENTKRKEEELKRRIAEFENWKASNKRRRTRQMMLTGEVPPEQLAFEADYEEISSKISKLREIEDSLRESLRASEEKFTKIKRDANNCVESLLHCRKLRRRYGDETETLNLEESRAAGGSPDNFELKTKIKAHKVFANMVISSYKKTIELLRKRQEKFLLIQALNELAGIYYAADNLSEAEVQWSDGVDTVFQSLYVIKNFRSVVAENESLCDKFGLRECLIGGMMLYRLSTYCGETKLHFSSECLLFGAELLSAPFKLALPNPQMHAEFRSFRCRDILTGRDLFSDENIINSSVLISALQKMSFKLLDREEFAKALPLLTFFEYIALEVVQSDKLVAQARLMKGVALANLGYINEAWQNLALIGQSKDLSASLQRTNLQVSMDSGANFFINRDSMYHNDLPPSDEKNARVIREEITKWEPAEEMAVQLGLGARALGLFLKETIIGKIYEKESIESLEFNETRKKELNESNHRCRKLLAGLSIEEELGRLFFDQYNYNLRDLARSEEKEAMQAKIDRFCEDKSVEAQEYVDLKNFKAFSYGEQRIFKLEMMARTRYLIARNLKNFGNLTRSVFVLQDGLLNMRAYGEGKLQVEDGEDRQTSTFKDLLDISVADGGAGGKKGAAVDKKAADKKAAADKKGGADKKKQKGKGDPATTTTEEEVDPETEFKKEVEASIEAAAADKHRTCLHAFWWIKLRYYRAELLYRQARYDDCLNQCEVGIRECERFQEEVFRRQYKQLLAQISLHKGKIQECIDECEKIISAGTGLSQHDISFCCFLGNYAELLEDRGHFQEAITIIQSCRDYLWARLRENGLIVVSSDTNADSLSLNVYINNEPERKQKDVEATPKTGEKGGAAAKKPADKKVDKKAAGDKKGAGQAAPTQEERVLPYEHEDSDRVRGIHKVTTREIIRYKIVEPHFEKNNNAVPPNIYHSYLELLIKAEVRFSHLLSTVGDYDLAQEVLDTGLKLADRCVFVTKALLVHLNFVQGKGRKLKFLDHLWQFQSEYKERAQTEKKYKPFLKHIPHEGVASGRTFLRLPGFNQKLREELIPILSDSEKYLRKSLELSLKESVLLEYDIGSEAILTELAQVAQLKGEFRSRVGFKYIMQRRPVKKLPGEGEEVPSGSAEEEEELDPLVKQQNEAEVEWLRAGDQMIHYLRAAIQAANMGGLLKFKIFELISGATLQEPTKCPLRVIQEVLESDFINKCGYKQGLFDEAKKKTSINASDALNYLRLTSQEMKIFSFGREDVSRVNSLLHRYLTTAFNNYQQKCILKAPEFQEILDKTHVILGSASFVGKWDTQPGQKTKLFYVLSPVVIEDVKVIEGFATVTEGNEEGTEGTKSIYKLETEDEVKNTLNGSILSENNYLGTLYQDTVDLRDAMEASEKFSAERNERDRKMYKMRFDQLIEQLGELFLPPVETNDEGQKLYTNEELFMGQVRPYIPELKIENVQLLIKFFDNSGFDETHVNYNAILRYFHRLRFR